MLEDSDVGCPGRMQGEGADQARKKRERCLRCLALEERSHGVGDPVADAGKRVLSHDQASTISRTTNRPRGSREITTIGGAIAASSAEARTTSSSQQGDPQQVSCTTYTIVKAEDKDFHDQGAGG
jgi:hypothetical protein